jgi:outer membrane receptor protein involved in Fe transport
MLQLNNKYILSFLLVLCVLVSGPAYSAAGGKISGRVTDASTGEAIPGANVIIEGTSMGAATNLEGEYFILNVPPGEYSVKASIIGYQSVIKTEVSVSLNHTTEVNFQIAEAVIELKESIVVLADRPLVQRDQTSTRHFVSAEEILARPTNELSQILLTLPGIDTEPGGQLSVRRGSLDQVAFLIDGMRASNPLDYEPYTNINLSSIQELEIITGGFNAEYGQAQSGVFNIVTKEGSRDLQLFTELRWQPPRVPHWGTPFYDYSSDRYWENSHARHLQWWIDNPDQWVDLQGIPGDDPNSSMTPEQAYEYYLQTHRPLTDYTKRSGYIGEFALGGPLFLNNLFFYFTGKYRSAPPVTGNSFRKEGKWYDGTLKLTYNFSPAVKLMFSGFYGENNTNIGMEYLNADFLSSYGIESKYAYYDFAGYPENRSDGETVQLTHVLGPSTFYQVQLSRIYRFRSQSTFPGDADGWESGVPVTDNLRAVDEFGGSIPGGYSNLIGLHTSGYYYRGRDKNTEYTLSGDLISQLNTKWQLKAGADFTLYNFDRYQEAKAFNAFEEKVYNPYEGDLYIQSKLEFEGLVINAGLRYDFYNANDEFYENIFDPFGTLTGTEPKVSATKTFGQLSPRLGVSHPISENTVLHFSYGHFFQRASYGDYGEGYSVLGILNTFSIDPGTGVLVPYNIGNRNLKPRKTVEFELGIEHNFGGIVADVTAYYKDITNTVRTVTILNRGLRYYTSANGDYGDSRGVEIALRKPLTGIWGGYLNYTFTGGIIGRSGTPERIAAPNSGIQIGENEFVGDAVVYDRPRLKFGATFLVPQDFDFLGGIFANIQFALDYQIYYPNANIASDVFSEGGKQFERTADKNAGLRIRKEFQFGNIRPAFFVEIQNVFNDTYTNLDIVKSASPEDRARFINSRFSIYPERRNNGAPFPDQMRYRNLPRQIVFGVAITY